MKKWKKEIQHLVSKGRELFENKRGWLGEAKV